MILDELLLADFGVYRGDQSIDLTPTSPDKPIVLFGGLNGGGKTTLLDALQLALYGRNARCSNRGALSYPEYLQKCIHSQADKGEGAAVEVQFRYRTEGREQILRVCRSWHVTKSGAVPERLEVLRVKPDKKKGEEDELDSALTDAWAEYVEAFMPLGISNLFFFDGEKIEGFADVDNASELLRTAIGALLGLDLVEQLSTDLGVLERRKRTESKTEGEQHKIEIATMEVKGLAERVADLCAQKGAAQNALDMARKALGRLERRFQKEGGEVYEQRSVLEAQRNAIVEQLRDARAQLRDLAADVTPLLVVEEAVVAIQGQDAREQEAERASDLVAVLTERDVELVKSLEGLKISHDARSSIDDFLARDRQERARAAEHDCYLGMSADARGVLSSLTPALAAARQQVSEIVGRIRRIRKELDRIEQRLESVPSQEAIAALQNEREQARVRMEAAKARLAGIDLELGQARRMKEKRDTQLNRLIEAKTHDDLVGEDAQRMIKHAKRVRATLQVFRERLVERHVQRIEQLILDSFRQLLRKQSLVSKLTIDPRTFVVEMSDRNGAVLAPDRLSAGERQLLATSMLWGLARASGRSLPAVIDTPMGRLDSNHRTHLIQRYFPYASHQVLLLSTDEEIDEGYFAKLKPHVGRSYRLDFDDQAGATEIKPGYFW